MQGSKPSTSVSAPKTVTLDASRRVVVPRWAANTAGLLRLDLGLHAPHPRRGEAQSGVARDPW